MTRHSENEAGSSVEVTPGDDPPASRCSYRGCQEPPINGWTCAGHLQGEPTTGAPMQGAPVQLPDYFRLPTPEEIAAAPPAPPDPTTWGYRPCCKSSGMVFNREGGHRVCVDCETDLRWPGDAELFRAVIDCYRDADLGENFPKPALEEAEEI